MEAHQFGGPWTVEKLDALRAYLIAYAQALKNQPFRRYYIDAFAGTGDRAAKRREAASLMEIPELDVMTKGSPAGLRHPGRTWKKCFRYMTQYPTAHLSIRRAWSRGWCQTPSWGMSSSASAIPIVHWRTAVRPLLRLGG